MEALSIFFKSFFMLILFLFGTACKVIVAMSNGVISVLEKTLLVLACYFGGVGILILLLDAFFGSGGIWKSLISIVVAVGFIVFIVTGVINTLCLLAAKFIKFLIDLVCKFLDGISVSCDSGLMNLLTSLRRV